MILITETRKKYHSHGNGGNSQHVSQVTSLEAESRGLTDYNNKLTDEVNELNSKLEELKNTKI